MRIWCDGSFDIHIFPSLIVKSTRQEDGPPASALNRVHGLSPRPPPPPETKSQNSYDKQGCDNRSHDDSNIYGIMASERLSDRATTRKKARTTFQRW